MTGKFQGVLDNSGGTPLTIHGLWGLRVGNSAFGGSSSLVFSAGPSSYNNGSVGVINPDRVSVCRPGESLSSDGSIM